jgi:hypothetical protein
MKRIMNIDSVNRCAMIETGVTFGELIPELKKHGLRLNIPLPPRKSKSVVTSRLDLEPYLIPKYQYGYVDPLISPIRSFFRSYLFLAASHVSMLKCEKALAELQKAKAALIGIIKLICFA